MFLEDVTLDGFEPFKLFGFVNYRSWLRTAIRGSRIFGSRFSID